jgi:NADPH:quinone reductase-like Zn-dependent oxidoreductase
MHAPNPADHRSGPAPTRPPGSPQDIPGLEVPAPSRAPERRCWLEAHDRVFGLVGGGGLADRVIVHQRCVAAVPSSTRPVAAVPEAFITAHDAIRSQAG